MTTSSVPSVTIETPAAGPLRAETAPRQEGLFAFSAARVLLGIMLLAAPLAFGAVQTWAWTSLAVLAVLLLLLWGIGCVQQRVLRIAWSPLYLPAALFLVFAAVQFFGHLTPDPIATREALLKLVTDMIFFFLAGQLFASGTEKAWCGLGLIVLVYAFLLSLFAVVQSFSSPGLIYWSIKPRWGGWIFGPYVNHNHYSGLMELLIPVSAGYVLSLPGDHPARTSLSFAVLVVVASFLLSGSRGGMIALIAEVLILGGVLFFRAPARCGRGVAMGAVGLTAAVLLFSWIDPGEVAQRLETVVTLARSPEITLGDRLGAARDSLWILRDHSWIGCGLGSFGTVFPRYQSAPSDLTWEHAHNDYAEALAETGLLGGTLILLALVMFFTVAFKDLRERLKREAGCVQLGAAVGCCGLLVHGFVDFNLHIPANAAWFAVCAAVATRTSIQRTAEPVC